MNRLTDPQLLRDYTERRSEAAFAELVRRHVDLVHSAALRMVCDAHLAEDVTQGAFVALAQNARQLTHHPVLSGWLHRTTQNLAAKAVRTDVRRRAREQEAAAMNELLSAEPDAVWEHIAPHLDAALGELGEADRDALLLRYFERKSAREMAQTLGISDEAAQKRVNRAVERLRDFFAKRGLTVGASGLVVVITANAVQAAPVGLAVTISTAAALAGTTLTTTTATATAIKAIAMTTLQKAIIAATLAAAIGTGIYEAHQASTLRSQVQTLRQQSDEQIQQLKTLTASQIEPSPRLPAPPIMAAKATEPPMDELPSTNLFDRLKPGEGEDHHLTAEQAESYLKANRRNAASLLAAFRTTRNPAFLEEAMQKYPDDPQVAFEAVFKRGAAPDEQRQLLDNFKRTAPENALANYFSALNYFKAGNLDQAVQELVAASGKQHFQDYSADRMQNDVEAFLAAGYPAAEAKTIGSRELIVEQFFQLKQLGQEMVNLANSYRQTGDEASAQAVLQMVMNLGQRYGNGTPPEFMVGQLVGISVERMALGAMNPTSLYGANGQTVQDYLNQITQQREALKQLSQQLQPVLPMMSDQDWISYTDRIMVSGEPAAMQWLFNKYGQK